MRPVYLLLFLLTVTASLGQTAEPLRIDSLPPQGILLDKGWKWHAGDNPDWAKPEFDDSRWERIDPTKDIFELPQLTKSGTISWLRIRLALDNFRNRQLVLIIQQSGASEMYLNGKLIHHFGVLSTKPEEIKAFNPMDSPVVFPTSPDSILVLSVRYALQPGILYATHFGMQYNGLRIRINTTENAFSTYIKSIIYNNKRNYRKVGIFSILSILFFSLFLFFPSRKVNLYFSIYSFFLVVTWSLFSQVITPNSIENLVLILNFILGLQVIGYLFMLAAVYNILDHKRGLLYWSMVALGVLSIPSGVFIYGWGWFVFGFLFTNLINVDITRIAVMAYQKSKKGAWIIVVGGVCFLLSWIIFCLDFYNIYTIDIGVDFFEISILSIPVAFAIFLGYDFGLTNRALKQKLGEVERLSSEKQQILSSQNETLERQVSERTTQLQQSLETLKITQTQLIQKEKMASLGELTAGIAHEIQNPLNFVNNFSEVSTELVEELKEEIKADRTDDALALAEDLSQNLQKISQHGTRASSIVKGMLEHSRTSTGQRQPTDLNALCDEYLRLAYHGLRAKAKEFNADLKTNLDPHLGKVNVVPQEIGRVLLNLFNNAFYAVQQRQNEGPPDFRPTVTVSTKRVGDGVEINISDNGPGIPDAIKNKIFQPFFTTKPTGEGTGLGLSLSYDIITKGHSGSLSLETSIGQGTTFTIQLPNGF